MIAWNSLVRAGRLAPVLLIAALLPGCAITPPVSPVTARCNLSLLNADVAQPPEQLRAFVGARTGGSVATAGEPVDNSLLLLSGGSQHGAFGAGYLAEWSRRRGQLPRFATVTGVSTGAIQSTWAFIRDPEVIEKEYAITRESQVLRPFVRRNSKGELTLGSYLAIAKRGAQADLEPLRKRLLTLIDQKLMTEIAREARERSLLIGLVDVDSGDALVANLGELALRHEDAAETHRPFLRACYVDAVIASSSAPPAAPPAFIDNRMYIDGGARFGIIGPAFLRVAQASAIDRQSPRMFMLVNGSQETKPQCGRRDPARCPEGADPTSNTNAPHRDWDLLDLALRSADILTGQIYRFSVAALANDHESSTGRKPYYAKINRAEMMRHVYPASRGKNCADWKAIDAAEDRPIEFFPRYMNCVIDYGRRRAVEMDWGAPTETRSDPLD